MKKFLYALMLVLGISAVSNAAVKPPKDDKGFTLPTLDEVGVETCRVNNSTSTNAMTCTTVPTIVYGVHSSSDAIGNFMTISNSTFSTTLSTVAFVWNQTNGPTQVAAATVLVPFVRPIKLSSGLSLKMNAAISVGTGEWVVYYRKLYVAPE